ncbi:MAG: hypothetical protein Q4C83_01535 [Candidatus Saccharibacteria bacterium]|nr:hypothetical protein [Candidatus Saccharibacteria bacterium]
MVDEMFDEVDLERRIYALFKLDVSIKAVIASNIPVSRSATATVFLTDKRLLFCFIDSPMRLTLGDVKKIISRMSLKPQQYIAPGADVDYFDDLAREKFNETFPGRIVVSDEDLYFYKTLTPYCPALVQISEVSGGVIKQYDSMAVGNWRPSVRFSYRRLQTS